MNFLDPFTSLYEMCVRKNVTSFSHLYTPRGGCRTRGIGARAPNNIQNNLF